MTETVERAKGKKISKPIVYGNTATPFGYKRESDGHSHQWTVFVKPYHYEDPSLYIRKVQFKLHDSYANPTRGYLIYPFTLSINRDSIHLQWSRNLRSKLRKPVGASSKYRCESTLWTVTKSRYPLEPPQLSINY